MSYGYIAETTHGDVSFTTDTHHEQHHNSVDDWWSRHGSNITSAVYKAINAAKQASDTVVNIIAIHEHVQGRRGKKVAHFK